MYMSAFCRQARQRLKVVKRRSTYCLGVLAVPHGGMALRMLCEMRDTRCCAAHQAEAVPAVSHNSTEPASVASHTRITLCACVLGETADTCCCAAHQSQPVSAASRNATTNAYAVSLIIHKLRLLHHSTDTTCVCCTKPPEGVPALRP